MQYDEERWVDLIDDFGAEAGSLWHRMAVWSDMLSECEREDEARIVRWCIAERRDPWWAPRLKGEVNGWYCWLPDGRRWRQLPWMIPRPLWLGLGGSYDAEGIPQRVWHQTRAEAFTALVGAWQAALEAGWKPPRLKPLCL